MTNRNNLLKTFLKFFLINLIVFIPISGTTAAIISDASTDGHEYVDLGLPSGTLWATCNIGANSPEEYGDYFAWGETEPQTDNAYTWTSYKWCNGSETTLTKYCRNSSYGNEGFTDGLTELEFVDDAAFMNWGNDWRIPSQEQFDELINSEYTTTEWARVNGVNGRKITSKVDGYRDRSIFLPATGLHNSGSLSLAGSYGFYWSRTPYSGSPNYARYLNFSLNDVSMFGYDRYYGLSVRPVRTVVEATCAEVNAGMDGVTYRVTGHVTSIVNTNYGNYYIEDETGQLYIYGTLDSNGNYPRSTSWESFGINVGDTITVQGPKATYNETAELVDVKLVQFVPLTLWSANSFTISSDPTEISVVFTCLSESYDIEIPENALSWLSVKSRSSKGNTNFVVLHIDENKSTNRYANVTFSTTVSGKEYFFNVNISQDPYYYTCTTEEGVEMRFRVTSDGEQKTCIVSGGIGQDIQTYNPAIDTLTSGHVTIPAEANGYTVTSIDFYAFKNCQNLTGVSIPETIDIMNNGAFAGCTNLADITFPSVLTDLGPEVFTETAWFANQPDGVVYINNLLYTYKGEMPENTEITVQESCTSISYGAFNGQLNLTKVKLPSRLERIGAFGFGYSGIRQVSIPESCTNIYTRGFQGCNSLEEVTLEGKTYLGIATFSKCPNLKKITCYSPEPPSTHASSFYYRVQDGNDNSIYSRATLYVPAGAKEAYQATTPWSEFQNIEEIQNINKHEYVDLGLPSGTLWATCNIGANSPEEYGDYFAWGETEPQTDNAYSWASYKWCKGSNSTLTKYCMADSLGNEGFTDELTELELEDDAAFKTWGPDWCMPSDEQYAELINSYYTTTEWTTENGVYGRKITSKTNGNSIFLPAAGCRIDSSLDGSGYGWYWSRTLYSDYSEDAWFLVFSSHNVVFEHSSSSRCIGQSIRPVRIDLSCTNIGNIYYKLNDEDNTAEVSANPEKYSGEIVVPERVEFAGKTYMVTEIGYKAFSECTGILSVSLPNTIESIGGYAFYACASLTELTIPNSVATIGVFAFDGCSNLQSITLPKTLKTIEYATFAYCDNLIYVDIPPSVETISDYAFYSCANLTELTLPNSVNRIGTYAFARCINLQSITLPKTLKAIEYATFWHCDNLVYVDIPPSVENIGKFAFQECASLLYATIHGAIKAIGQQAFCYCSGLQSVTIGENIEEIGYYAFYGCTSLTTVNSLRYYPFPIDEEVFPERGNATLYVPAGASEQYETTDGWSGFAETWEGQVYTNVGLDGLKYEFDSRWNGSNVERTARLLGEYVEQKGKLLIPSQIEFDEKIYAVSSIIWTAFQDKTELTSVIIPETVTHIEYRAFMNCSNLTNVVFPESVTYIGSDAFAGTPWYENLPEKEIIYIGKVAYAYKGEMPANTEIKIREGTTMLGTKLFRLQTNLTGISLPEGLSTIGERAFQGCTGLTSCIIPSSVKNIANYAFLDCTDLTSLVIPESCDVIGAYAFARCTGLTSILLPDRNQLQSIEYGAFYGCTNLTDVSIWWGFDIQEIEDWAFAYCSNLNAFDLPPHVIFIGECAFLGCTELSHITIPASVINIEVPVFYQCHNLSKIVVENGNEVYDSREGCNAIIETATNKLVAGCKETVIPHSVTTIGEDAFWHNYAITSIVIPESVTTIEALAFGSCQNLADVVIPSSVKEIGRGAFQACKFSSFQIPEALTTIELYAFSECPHLKEVVIPNKVKTIGNEAFDCCDSLTTVTIGSAVDSIGSKAFGSCNSLRNIISLIEEPFAIGDDVFTYYNAESEEVLPLYDLATLYVPAGRKAQYEAIDGWKRFSNIVEMDIEPLEEGDKVDFGENEDINADTNLDGNIVGNLYFNISNENGSYSPDEGCIIINESTSDEEMEGIIDKEFFDKDLKETFTGIIFKVPEGEGNIKITAETTGSMTMKVKIGSNEPIEMELEGKLKVKFPYNVSEETLVYIYAGESAEARGRRFSDSSKGSLKIYGIECETIPDDITTVEVSDPAEPVFYNLNGQRMLSPQKGIVIKNGKKIQIK